MKKILVGIRYKKGNKMSLYCPRCGIPSPPYASLCDKCQDKIENLHIGKEAEIYNELALLALQAADALWALEHEKIPDKDVRVIN
jgi:ribosomal protein L40E